MKTAGRTDSQYSENPTTRKAFTRDGANEIEFPPTVCRGMVVSVCLTELLYLEFFPLAP